MAEKLHDVTLVVNGVPQAVRVPARRLLSDCLRHDLGLYGTHVGCEHGVCGCCTVLLDGAPVRSCLMFAVSAQEAAITTVEGLAPAEGELSAVQRAFGECHGLQCGFCTPGFLTTVTAFLAENPAPTQHEVVEAISGNLCRCTGYQNIVAAVLRAAELARGRRPSSAEDGLESSAVSSAVPSADDPKEGTALTARDNRPSPAAAIPEAAAPAAAAPGREDRP